MLCLNSTYCSFLCIQRYAIHRAFAPHSPCLIPLFEGPRGGSPLLVTRLWDDGVDQVASRIEHGMDRLTELLRGNGAKELLVDLEIL